jgi:hypothetical protein
MIPVSSPTSESSDIEPSDGVLSMCSSSLPSPSSRGIWKAIVEGPGTGTSSVPAVSGGKLTDCCGGASMSIACCSSSGKKRRTAASFVEGRGTFREEDSTGFCKITGVGATIRMSGCMVFCSESVSGCWRGSSGSVKPGTKLGASRGAYDGEEACSRCL